MAEANPEISAPQRGAHILEWFWDASDTRRCEQGSPQRLTPVEWAAWAALTGFVVTRDELMILRKIDAAFVEAFSEERAAQIARGAKQEGDE